MLPLCKLDLIVPEVATQDAEENLTQKSYLALDPVCGMKVPVKMCQLLQ